MSFRSPPSRCRPASRPGREPQEGGDFVAVPPSRPVRSRVPAFLSAFARWQACFVAPTISVRRRWHGRWE
jgi:hypothetical protein